MPYYDKSGPSNSITLIKRLDEGLNTSVRRIFERPRNLRILKTKRKVFLLRFGPVSGPELGEDQKKKKRSSLGFSPVFGPKVDEDQQQKKSLQSDSIRL